MYDKYAAFLHGNNGLSRVEGDGEGRILVVKDSYANSLIPFLTANYAQIDVIDLRNYNYGLDGLIAENGYDQILVLYSFDSFKERPLPLPGRHRRGIKAENGHPLFTKLQGDFYKSCSNFALFSRKTIEHSLTMW